MAAQITFIGHHVVHDASAIHATFPGILASAKFALCEVRVRWLVFNVDVLFIIVIILIYFAFLRALDRLGMLKTIWLNNDARLISVLVHNFIEFTDDAVLQRIHFLPILEIEQLFVLHDWLLEPNTWLHFVALHGIFVHVIILLFNILAHLLLLFLPFFL